MAKKEVSTVVVDFNESLLPDFVAPSAFFYRDALGNKVFIKVSSKKKAVEYVISEYGYEKYKVVSEKQEKTGGNLSCRGAVNSASRKGAMVMNIYRNQGGGLR